MILFILLLHNIFFCQADTDHLRNNSVDFLTWDAEFVITMKIKVTADPSSLRSVFHFSTEEEDLTQLGARNPAAFINSGPRIEFHQVMSSLDTTVIDIEINKTYSFVVRQTKHLDKFAYEIHLDGDFKKSKVNSEATSFTNLTVWLSNPWYDTFDGVLEEFDYYSYSSDGTSYLDRASYGPVRSSLVWRTGLSDAFRAFDDSWSTYFVTSLDSRMRSPWVELELTSEVSGVGGIQVSTYYGFNFRNVRISAGPEPSSQTDGEVTNTIEHVNTYLGQWTGDREDQLYITFPTPVTAKYLLLQTDSGSQDYLGLRDVKLLVTSLICSEDYDDGSEAGLASMEYGGSVFQSEIRYSCGPGQKFSGTSRSTTISQKCTFRGGCDGVCWKYTNTNKLPHCIPWCLSSAGKPSKPSNSMETSLLNYNGIGQVVTYTCRKGYEFLEDPVSVTTPEPTTQGPSTTTTTTTTTTTVNVWTSFAGAEYYMGTDSGTDSWEQARAKCQALGGDLASITSFPVQKFLSDTFQDLQHNKWIGGKRTTSGTYEWVNGDAFEFTDYSCGLSPSKECLAMGSEGRWEDQDCSRSDIDRFLCQKGSSSIQFWKDVEGYGKTFGQLSHLESSCVTSAQQAAQTCAGYGALLASLPFTSALELVQAEFGSHMTKPLWIGLNDRQSEGTFVWEDGSSQDDSLFKKWDKNSPENTESLDCVVLNTGFKWELTDCSSTNSYGQLCMKGGPFEPPTFLYTRELNNKRYSISYRFKMTSDSNSEEECCTKCGLYSQETNVITRDGGGADKRCWCQTVQDIATADIDRNVDNWTSGTCVANTNTGRRRRETELDTSKERRLECVSWLGGTAAYWRYEYEVPSRCHIVSCLRSDLESIAANNQQIELSTPISSLHYGTTYRFECKTFGQEFQLEDGSFQYHAEVTCQEDKTWTAVTDQCQWAKCIVEPSPPDDSNLVPITAWDPSNPTSQGDTFDFQCNAGSKWNRFESDFSKNNLSVECLPDNKFADIAWPTCVNGTHSAELTLQNTIKSDISCPDPASLNTEEIVFSGDPGSVQYQDSVSWVCKDKRYLVRPRSSSLPPSDSQDGECQWDKTYSVTPSSLSCVLTYCRHPHDEPGSHQPPPPDHNLSLLPLSNWSVPLGEAVTYQCEASGQYFESDQPDPGDSSLTVSCLAESGEYNTPVVEGGSWPSCTSTVLCDDPPSAPLNGSSSWEGERSYNSSVSYLCQDGSQFDSDGDGTGDTVSVSVRCQWSKVWSSTTLPVCLVTHCVQPFPIPDYTNLEETSSAWTPVNTYKEYQCRGKTGGLHTRFWESDRSQSTFRVFCRPDGLFEWRDWPTCLEDISCSPEPPVIPTHSEYTRPEYDGTVTVNSLQYPALLRTTDLVLTSHTNNTLLPRNYMANLTYYCGDAREFFHSDGSQSVTQSMTCQWDKTWTPTTQLGTCDWVACLKPPSPPSFTNLRLTDWDGEPVMFGGEAVYVCERGHHFHDHYERPSVSFTCQGEGAANKGFFDVPERELDWPRCSLAPVCPEPPPAPTDGVREHLPLEPPVDRSEKCFLNGDLMHVTCHSFLNIYPTAVTYGRQAAAKKELCGGQSPADTRASPVDCYDEEVNLQLLNVSRDLCRGHFNCSQEVPTVILSPACDGMRREYKIEYICVYCTDWASYLSASDCLDQSLVQNKWASSSSLLDLQEADKISLLVENLHYFYSSGEHPLVELRGREVSGGRGSLCGLSAIYQAARDTILSPAQIKARSYDQLRELLGLEMGLDLAATKALSDQQLLEQFYEWMCKSQPSKRWSEESHLKRETSPEEVEVRSAGSRLRYECGLARRFYNLELSSNGTYHERMMQCNWNRSWTPESSLDPCVWVQCINPPPPPGGSGMRFVWDGSPVEFGQNVSYVCEEEGLYFEAGREISEFNVTCLSDGSWRDVVWPRCISSVNCTDPPARPASGTWQWDGNREYGAEASYTCGLYGHFRSEAGIDYNHQTSVCGWNKSWVPDTFDPCVASSCQYIPFPPPHTGMVHLPDPDNSLSLLSETSIYNPSLPFNMKFPKDFCSDNGDVLMIVGSIPDKSKEHFEIVFPANGSDEAFHALLDLDRDVVQRWAFVDNATQEFQGEPFEGTTIDREEPFMIRVECDEDGWSLKVNEEDPYEHFFHQESISISDITSVLFKGEAIISYIGIGQDLTPAPPVGFNLTFICNTGKVFSHDWFAAPFIMMTCQPDGAFDEPDWSQYECVHPTTTACFDCTTTSK